jgi:hypothetical protein
VVAVAAPAIAAVVVAAMAVLMPVPRGVDSAQVGIGLVRVLANLLPLAAGLAAASALGRERMVELQLTMPTSYRVTTRRRLELLLGMSLAAAAAAIVALAVTGRWEHPAAGPLALLVPIGPAVFLIGVAAWAQVRLLSTAASSTVVIGGWLFQALVFDRFVQNWQLNRGLLIVIGLVLMSLALRRLQDGERLLRGMAE